MSLQRASENTAKIKNYLRCLHFSYATYHLTFNKTRAFQEIIKPELVKSGLGWVFSNQVLMMGQSP